MTLPLHGSCWPRIPYVPRLRSGPRLAPTQQPPWGLHKLQERSWLRVTLFYIRPSLLLAVGSLSALRPALGREEPAWRRGTGCTALQRAGHLGGSKDASRLSQLGKTD